VQINIFQEESSCSFPLIDFTDSVDKAGLIDQKTIQQFQTHIWDFYRLYGRPFIWREQVSSYNIVVSEIMLQQTQTERVKVKFLQFIDALPSFEALAQASTREVLSLWQGLGYNRRGLALHKIAQKIMDEYTGILPNDPEVLQTFPGIGPATAASICAFAFNRPTVFIETNIRAVFLHLFFKNQSNVSDKALLPLIEQAICHKEPRQWYYALMDYGVMLKKRFKNPSRKSKHHSQQSKFEGSERQIRGQIVRILTQEEGVSFEELCKYIDRDPERIKKNIDALVGEGLVTEVGNFYSL
jgi:A/G-specific adenine glycosylase